MVMLSICKILHSYNIYSVLQGKCKARNITFHTVDCLSMCHALITSQRFSSICPWTLSSPSGTPWWSGCSFLYCLIKLLQDTSHTNGTLKHSIITPNIGSLQYRLLYRCCILSDMRIGCSWYCWACWNGEM